MRKGVRRERERMWRLSLLWAQGAFSRGLAFERSAAAASTLIINQINYNSKK